MPISRIKTDGIQDDAITSAKIGDTNIQSADIAAGAVTSAKLDTNIDVAGTLDVTSTTTLDSTLAVAGHGSIGNAGTVDGTRALTVVGATDGSSSSIIVGYNSSLASKFSVRDDGYTSVGNGLNLADGNLSFASGHGIDFSGNSNASGMSSELLDDYEEGTWTPTMHTSNADLTATIGIQFARYVKIGQSVYVSAYIVPTITAGSSGYAYLSNLPFTVTSATGAVFPWFNVHGSALSSSGGYLGGNGRMIAITNNSTAGINWNSGIQYSMFCCTYMTDA